MRLPFTALTAALVLSVAGCGSTHLADPDQVAAPAAPGDVVALGRRLFTQETFAGNGRVCSTCHELDRFGTITPEYVQQLFAADPATPLFRSLDSDDGLGQSYERLLEDATIRVPIELSTRTASGLVIRKCADATAAVVYVNRGNPSVFNVALESNLMLDGRDGSDLEKQVRNAVHAHGEPGREPTQQEVAAIAAFQASLLSNRALRGLLEEGADLALPEGNTPAEKRGRAFFEPDRQCGQCHSGPLLNRTSAYHPNAVGFGFESAFVGREPNNPNEKFMWCYVDPTTNEIAAGPEGRPEVFGYPVPDPGRGLVAGVTEFRAPDGKITFLPNELLVRLTGPLFKIPTLWGVTDTEPYFHDNSAKNLDDVLDQYNFVFSFFPDGSFGLGCDLSAPQCLSAQDKADIIAFLRLLSFDDR